jgi:hypothetical protein
MDMGATAGATAEWDIEALENTGLPSTKVWENSSYTCFF